MLYLKRNIWNPTVYTASENAGSTGNTYNLHLQPDITGKITDYSEHPERYNISNVAVVETIINWQIDTAYSIAVNEVYVAYGDVAIGASGSLTNNGTLVIFQGGITGSGYTGSTGSTLDENVGATSISNHTYCPTGLTGSLIMIDINNDFHDYVISKDSDNTVVLDFGKAYVKPSSNAQVISTYTTTQTTYTYEPGK